MAALDDMLKGNLLVGLGLGLGAVLFMPVAGQVLRPAVKGLIKGAMLAYQGLAEFSEIATDIVAEAQHELAPQIGEAEPARRSASRRGVKARTRRTASKKLFRHRWISVLKLPGKYGGT